MPTSKELWGDVKPSELLLFAALTSGIYASLIFVACTPDEIQATSAPTPTLEPTLIPTLTLEPLPTPDHLTQLENYEINYSRLWQLGHQYNPKDTNSILTIKNTENFSTQSQLAVNELLGAIDENEANIRDTKNIWEVTGTNSEQKPVPVFLAFDEQGKIIAMVCPSETEKDDYQTIFAPPGTNPDGIALMYSDGEIYASVDVEGGTEQLVFNSQVGEWFALSRPIGGPVATETPIPTIEPTPALESTATIEPTEKITEESLVKIEKTRQYEAEVMGIPVMFTIGLHPGLINAPNYPIKDVFINNDVLFPHYLTGEEIPATQLLGELVLRTHWKAWQEDLPERNSVNFESYAELVKQGEGKYIVAGSRDYPELSISEKHELVPVEVDPKKPITIVLSDRKDPMNQFVHDAGFWITQANNGEMVIEITFKEWTRGAYYEDPVNLGWKAANAFRGGLQVLIDPIEIQQNNVGQVGGLVSSDEDLVNFLSKPQQDVLQGILKTIW